jgi:membrane-bound serine protease (ClpP class)
MFPRTNNKWLSVGLLSLLSCLFLLVDSGLSASTSPASSGETLQRILRIELDGIVSQATSAYVERAVEAAVSDGADAILMRLDTPGGSLEATRAAVGSLIQSNLPLLIFIGPEGARAGSAGVFFTLAAHRVGMAEATRLGAAHPVSSQGEDIKGDMGKKIENDTVSWARSIAELRGRPAEWAEKAVRESATLTAREAVSAGVADLLAPTEQEFLNGIGSIELRSGQHPITLAPSHTVRAFHMTLAEKIVHMLSHPNLVYVLLLAGMFGIFIEFKSPGLIVPGALGAFCLALVFGVQALPINGFGLLLILGGGILLVLDIYVPSLGLLSIAGISGLIFGSYLLFADPELVGTAVSEPLIWAVGLSFGASVLFIGGLIAKAQFKHHRGAGPDLNEEADTLHEAEVFRDITLDSEGTIFYKGSYWNARFCTEDNQRSLPEQAPLRLPAGSKVWIKGWDGLTAQVTPRHSEQEIGKAPSTDGTPQ